MTSGVGGEIVVIGQKRGNMTTEDCAIELKGQPSGLRQLFNSPVTVEDLYTEIALLKQQLMEAQLLVFQSGQATAVASDVKAEEVRMQNRELQKTVKELREENAVLLQLQQELDQAVEEFRTETRDYITRLFDDIENLESQLSKQHLRCKDAERQRDAQKQLFLKLFKMVKQDMKQNNTQHAKDVKHSTLEDYLRMAAKRTASPRDNGNEVAPVPSTEDKIRNNLAHAQGTHAPKRVRLLKYQCPI
eukprot:CAMPEP_0172780092 /NCGR_PEP_ID=MMETSP1074-20121228/202751_1 /TAXON_ID=2916 /ORGANISM="Ceratium fusus, Strain PA161109" /LENGTH=245 /DNA_ID=CAMNT_0013617061 /DNA_START=49 /DNA_END=786 /DNA_ORIENTATION=-